MNKLSATAVENLSLAPKFYCSGYMKNLLLRLLMFVTIHSIHGQDPVKNKEVLKPIQEDSTTLYKIIPAEIPQPVIDSLQTRHFQLGDVYTAHRNGTRTMFVVVISHELVRETFWFDPKGRQLRASAKRTN